MHPSLRILAQRIHDAGGHALLVGGAVRDQLLGLTPKDWDVEVFHMDSHALVDLLTEHYPTSTVGASFGVLKVRIPGIEDAVDISIPRSQRGHGLGFHDFAAPEMSTRDAAIRRDLTINALMLDPLNGNLIDHFGGQKDLRARRLHFNDPDSFAEDPLRILRTAQFAARFNCALSKPLHALCTSLNLDGIASERIGVEWRKLLLKSPKPSVGIRVLQHTDNLEHVRELRDLIDVPQNPKWHPEGCAFTHTLHVIDAAAEIVQREQLCEDDAFTVLLSALCHDLGKASTTAFRNGNWTSPGHAAAGVPLSEALLERIDVPPATIKLVLPLVREHMNHIGLPVASRAIKRLAVRLQPANLELWGHLVESDQSGRPPLPKHHPAQKHIELARSLDLGLNAPKPLIQGRDLIALGLTPGRTFGDILRKAFQAQINEEFSTTQEGIAYLTRRGILSKPTPKETPCSE